MQALPIGSSISNRTNWSLDDGIERLIAMCSDTDLHPEAMGHPGDLTVPTEVAETYSAAHARFQELTIDVHHAVLGAL